jgi:hypothetical protein
MGARTVVMGAQGASMFEINWDWGTAHHASAGCVDTTHYACMYHAVSVSYGLCGAQQP